MSRVQVITVSAEDANQRLDRWFKRMFPQISQGHVEKMCRKGEIRVDGGRVKGSTRLTGGQSVRVPPLPEGAHPAPSAPQRLSAADAAFIRSCVLYLDDHVIALNKPPGLAVQGGSGQSSRHVDGLAAALTFDLDEKPRLVHRLDKDTSGVLLMARTRSVAAALTASFRHRETRKIYWAVVAGVPQPKRGTIRYALVKAAGRSVKGEGEKMIAVHPAEMDHVDGAKRATTEYTVLAQAGSRTCWAALVPVTGRTHQLRAHMAEIGHPIVGDGKYGGSGQENLGDGWGAQLGGDISKKLHLHARSLSLEHPVTKANLHLVAPLPDHMQRTWDTFQWRAGDVPVDPFDETPSG
ncbi:MAG: RluA family pseudouridine synthase [Pseudomonadota bacterium]